MSNNVIQFPHKNVVRLQPKSKNKTSVELRLKIENRMQVLEDMMDQNFHQNDPEFVKEHIAQITKFWHILSEEDQEYCQVARHACEEGWSWK